MGVNKGNADWTEIRTENYERSEVKKLRKKLRKEAGIPMKIKRVKDDFILYINAGIMDVIGMMEENDEIIGMSSGEGNEIPELPYN